MALYGYIAPNKRPNDPYGDYFSETRKMIDAKTAIDQASKAAEDAALESIGELPELGPNSMFMSYGDAYKQMATYLRDNKDELLATEEGRKQYQQLLDGAAQWSAYGKDHTAKVNPLLSTRMKIARSGVNPQEWESQGLKDKHSYDEYVAKTSELDSARFNVTVKNGQWVVNDEAGEHSINDESLFDLSFFKDFQVETSPDSPSVWYTTHKPKNDGKAFKDKEDAKEWTAATIMSGGGKGKRDAVRWFVSSDKNTDGLTADQINSDETGNALDRAVDAYAEEAVSGWEKFVEKSKDDKKESKGALSLKGASDDYNELINIEDNYGGYDSTEMKVTDPETGSQTVVPAFTSTYNFLGKAKKASPEISLDEFEGSSKISSISYDTFTSSWKITLSDGSQSEFNRNPEDEERFYVPGMRDERGGRVSKMKHFANQFDAVHGDGSFTALLSQLQTKAKKELTF